MVLIIPFSGMSQESDDYKTLFGSGKDSFGGYLGLDFRYTKINEQDVLMIGGELNALFNHSFALGFKGFGMVSPVKSSNSSNLGEQLYFGMGYGGVNIEPILFYNSAIHLSIPILIGGGGIAEYSQNYYHYHDQIYFDDYNYEYDYFFVLEPGINLEINLLKFMRLSTGASYRITSDMELSGMNGTNLNGLNFDLSLKFGWF
jgi:hypothetical protein